jgi:hypothetical protein
MQSTSRLKSAFARARASGNIEDIYPEFLKAKLFVVAKKVPTSITPVFYLQRSPNPNRWCITVSESKAVFERLQDVELVEYVGKDLLGVLDRTHEIVVTYVDGGDYLTTEQLDYFRGM